MTPCPVRTATLDTTRGSPVNDHHDDEVDHHYLSLEVPRPSLAGAPDLDAVIEALRTTACETRRLCDLLAALQTQGWCVELILDGEVILRTADRVTGRQVSDMVERLPDGLRGLARRGLCWPGCAQLGAPATLHLVVPCPTP